MQLGVERHAARLRGSTSTQEQEPKIQADSLTELERRVIRVITRGESNSCRQLRLRSSLICHESRFDAVQVLEEKAGARLNPLAGPGKITVRVWSHGCSARLEICNHLTLEIQKTGRVS